MGCSGSVTYVWVDFKWNLWEKRVALLNECYARLVLAMANKNVKIRIRGRMRNRKSPCQLTFNSRTARRKRSNFERWEMFYIPIHRDEAAMDGAPDRLWLIEGEQATAKTEANPSPSTALRVQDDRQKETPPAGAGGEGEAS